MKDEMNERDYQWCVRCLMSGHAVLWEHCDFHSRRPEQKATETDQVHEEQESK